MNDQRIAPYGAWESPVGIEFIDRAAATAGGNYDEHRFSVGLTLRR